jgi:uncharacterized protein YukE
METDARIFDAINKIQEGLEELKKALNYNKNSQGNASSMLDEEDKKMLDEIQKILYEGGGKAEYKTLINTFKKDVQRFYKVYSYLRRAGIIEYKDKWVYIKGLEASSNAEPAQEPAKSITPEEIKSQILAELEQKKVMPLIELEKKYKDQKAMLDQALKELQDNKKIKIVNNYVSLEMQDMPKQINREAIKLKERLEQLEKKKQDLEETIMLMKKFGQDKIKPDLLKEREEELKKVTAEIAQIQQQIYGQQ